MSVQNQTVQCSVFKKHNQRLEIPPTDQ